MFFGVRGRKRAKSILLITAVDSGLMTALSWHLIFWFTYMCESYVYVCLCASCRGSALWPLSRFLALTQYSTFPLVPWERLRLPLLWQSLWADCSLRDLPLWSVPPNRWVNAHEATGSDLVQLCTRPTLDLTKFSVCCCEKTFTQWRRCPYVSVMYVPSIQYRHSKIWAFIFFLVLRNTLQLYTEASYSSLPCSISYFSPLCVLCPPSPAKQLAYIYPRLYNCSVPAGFLADLPQLAQLCEGSKPPLASDKGSEQLFSIYGDKFVSFVKSEHFVDGKTFLLCWWSFMFYFLDIKGLICDILHMNISKIK